MIKNRISFLFIFFSILLYSQDKRCFENYNQDIKNLLKDNNAKQAMITFNNMVMACEDNLKKIDKLQKEIAKKGNYEILSKDNIYAFNELHKYEFENKEIRKPRLELLFKKRETSPPELEYYYPKEIIDKKDELKLDFVKYIYGEKYLLAKKNNKYGIFDLEFNEILPIEYDRFNPKDILIITKDGKESIFDFESKKIIFPFYKEVESVSHKSSSNAKRFVKIYKTNNSNAGLFYLDGSILIDFPEEGMNQNIIINEDAKVILVDRDNTDVIYDFNRNIIASDFHFWRYDGAKDTFIIKNNEGEMGVINSKGKMIIPFSSAKISNWGDFFNIDEVGKKGIKDQKNNYIIPAIYDNISFPVYDTFIVEQNDKYGLLNKYNQIIIPIEYDYIKKANDDYLLFFVSKNKKVGMFNIKGKEVIPTIYDKYKISNDDKNTFEFEKDGKTFKFVNPEE
ncbi:WG repeat-containing protein [Empedobacter sp. UBA7248]|uniref:WG repeat-containing protein n=1 Tax=Empedobacter sp. UBA7248 TaxID=1946448 RepID=UPI0025B97885|nr:WG repeat-containing protein [Empedobacter sp. UBA7248]